MRADFFYYTETNRRPWAEQVARGAQVVTVDVPENATLPEMVALARNNGLGAGTQRSGLFEVQTDKGIYQHARPDFRERGYGKLDPNNAHFTPWEE